MHELGITMEIVDIVNRRADGAKVTRVVLEIGKLSAVLPDAVRFCFPSCAEGTTLEGAELEILETPGKASCRRCNAVSSLRPPPVCCSASRQSTTLRRVRWGSRQDNPWPGKSLSIRSQPLATFVCRKSVSTVNLRCAVRCSISIRWGLVNLSESISSTTKLKACVTSTRTHKCPAARLVRSTYCRDGRFRSMQVT